MKAMCLEEIKRPLRMCEVEVPAPAVNEVLIQVGACGVCRTDLHIIDGRTAGARIFRSFWGIKSWEKLSSKVVMQRVTRKGERVGVPWLRSTCHACEFCVSLRENLCDHPVFTGYQCNGGYAGCLRC